MPASSDFNGGKGRRKMVDVKTAARLALELSKLEPAELNTIVGIADERRKATAAPKVAKQKAKAKKEAAAAAPTGKKRGRPAGTKNKPKEQEQADLPMEAEAATEEQEQTH